MYAAKVYAMLAFVVACLFVNVATAANLGEMDQPVRRDLMSSLTGLVVRGVDGTESVIPVPEEFRKLFVRQDFGATETVYVCTSTGSVAATSAPTTTTPVVIPPISSAPAPVTTPSGSFASSGTPATASVSSVASSYGSSIASSASSVVSSISSSLASATSAASSATAATSASSASAAPTGNSAVGSSNTNIAAAIVVAFGVAAFV